MKEKLSSLAEIKKLKQKVEEKKETLRFSLHVFKFLSGVEYLPPKKQEEFEKTLEQPDGIGLPLKYSLSKKQKNQWNKKMASDYLKTASDYLKMASDYLESIQDPLQQPPSPLKNPKTLVQNLTILTHLLKVLFYLIPVALYPQENPLSFT